MPEREGAMIASVSLSGGQRTGPSAWLDGIVSDRSRARSSPIARRQWSMCCRERGRGLPHTSVFN